ncbi:cytidine deaminase [Marinicella sp. S1101]|uniref:cytidine deaminase n=1 Tax=Marinicella marina TaxID=2996016 RepID=UPI002260BAE7|nr:cytidine deaminase [Marinicella marina]MCX7553506.1 cytidine deaminase [Marinicella marina]MDJ1140130.1 cytidine deaminase [Marinicella marina]
MNIDDLYQAALTAKEKAYAPYSKFKVGAAIIDENGQVHSGCNVENAAYPLGCCAEQSAVSQMIINGGSTIQHILIVGKSGESCPPCGACRQIIFEHGNKNTQVHLESQNGSFDQKNIFDLLPEAFDHLQLDK